MAEGAATATTRSGADNVSSGQASGKESHGQGAGQVGAAQVAGQATGVAPDDEGHGEGARAPDHHTTINGASAGRPSGGSAADADR